MAALPWILIGLIVLGILFAVAALMFKKKNKIPPDYYTFFIMGITWVPLGFALDNPAFTVMGIVFMAVGLLNKDKWKKNHRPWNKMSKEERNFKMVVIALLGLLVLFGLVAFFFVRTGILTL